MKICDQCEIEPAILIDAKDEYKCLDCAISSDPAVLTPYTKFMDTHQAAYPNASNLVAMGLIKKFVFELLTETGIWNKL